MAKKKMSAETRKRLAAVTGRKLDLSQRAVEIRRKFVGRMMQAGAVKLAISYLKGERRGAEVARILYSAAEVERDAGRWEAADAAEQLAQMAALLDSAHKGERGAGCALSLVRQKIGEAGGSVAKLGLKLNGTFAVTYLVGGKASAIPALSREPAYDTVAHVSSVARKHGVRAELRDGRGHLVASISGDGSADGPA